jgi:uncharacterized protein (UPF0548 family)
MFLASRPPDELIRDFLRHSKTLPLSYRRGDPGENPFAGFRLDEASGSLGLGEATLQLAKRALSEWRHFDLGWVELHPADAEIEQGNVVAVLVRHLGFFSYGTLANHAEMGEELFEVGLNAESGEVTYRIRAFSKPRAAWARIGYPITRSLQARFRRDSIAAMQRAVRT